MKRTLRNSMCLALCSGVLLFGVVQIGAAVDTGAGQSTPPRPDDVQSRVDAVARKHNLPTVRADAAQRRSLLYPVATLAAQDRAGGSIGAAALDPPGPGGVPDYFGFTPNYAWSPRISKFVDTLPGLGSSNANNLGNYIPVGKPDTITYPGSDYYEIELREYSQQMHSELPATRLRGYVQANKGTDTSGKNTLAPDPIHYLGPILTARKGRPVRIKFTNKLPTGAGGDLFLPVDKTVMGAGAGPAVDGSGNPIEYTQNRGTIHLHGGKTVWISDGTPHQWISPAGEDTPYPKGVSVKPVPDMPDPGDGSMTFFYSNQQSSRMLWFHDHVYGLTRLNVYAGEAAGYMLTDDTEQRLIREGTVPADQIPLILQDKTFVDASTIASTDPTWDHGTTAPVPNTGDLWFPHVYMPNQNPYDVSGANPMGRWDYGLWFWPPTTDISHGTVPNPYYDPYNAPWEPPLMPGVPKDSSVMEAFMDTPIVNGTAYPTVTLKPKAYRFRILNAANDRTWNLQLYQADPTVWTIDGRSFTEVKMVPAAPTAGFPPLWPVDGRPGGVPDPAMRGPNFIQIGNEGGFLAKPAIIENQPVDWNLNMKNFTFGNVSSKALCLAPAERADVIIDFSKYAGRTLILYNDAPAAFPANDPRNDYFTNDPDNSDSGGTTPTEAGFGPNTRTVMQIKIEGKPAPAFNMAKLNAAFASTPATPGVFATSQDPIIVAQSAYDSTYATSFPTAWPLAGYANINDYAMDFMTVAGTVLKDFKFQSKGMHDEMGGAYDDYGRMAGKLGLAISGGSAITQGFIPQTYIDPSTENITDSMTPMSPVAGDGTQIWKITHNGVDTHPIHFHLFDIQLINRVGWDGAIDLPDPNELGWKETLRVNPLQDTIVALRPTAPTLPFGVPESVRLLDPTQKQGESMGFSQIDPLTGNPLVFPNLTTNEPVNFGWEYMWHCHILSHEEMEMMRPVSFDVNTTPAGAPVLAAKGVPGSDVDLKWIDATPASDPSTWGDPRAEIGFRIERRTVDTAGSELVPYSTIATELANWTTYTDKTTAADTVYNYRVIAYNAQGEVGSIPATVSAPGALDSYMIRPWANSGGSITPSSTQVVAKGADSVAYAIAANSHNVLNDVLIDGVSVGTTSSVTLKNVQANHTVWAVFGPELVPLTIVTGGGGTITPGGTVPPAAVNGSLLGMRQPRGIPGIREAHSVPYGTHVTFGIMPQLGYHIEDVTIDGKSVGAVYSYTLEDVTTPHTVAAVFAPSTYTVTPSVKAGNGSTTPSTPQTVEYGGSTTIAFTPAAGNRVSDVLVNGESIGAVKSVTLSDITSDQTVEVTFTSNMTVWRFRNLRNGFYLWTADENEKNDIVKTLSNVWLLEGPAYELNPKTNTDPLWRFLNLAGGYYLFTADAAEKDQIRATLPGVWRYEGPAYDVSRTTGSPVWRFRNVSNAPGVSGTYFYTADPAEKDTIVATLKSTWLLEGVSYFIAP